MRCGRSASCSTALWVALLVQVVLTFPEGRPWSRAARIAIAGAYAATFGGQLVGAFVLPDSRDVLSVTPQQTVADAVDRAQGSSGIAVALAVLVLLVRRLLVLRGPAQRAQAPLLAAAALTVPAALLWLAWVSATGEDAPTLETIGRAVSLLVPLGVVAGIVWSRLRRRGGVRPRRRAADGGGDQPARAARPGTRRPDARRCVSPRRRPLRRRRRPDRSSSRRARIGRSRW